MEIKLTLSLPRDAISIPVARRICTRSMEVLGVERECVHDIEVAVTEACANVLKHADTSDEYEVSIGIDGDVAVIEVVDRGRGFDAHTLGHVDAEQDAEQGRGLQLIRSLTDTVRFDSRAEEGSIVHFEKNLEYPDGAPLKVLNDHKPAMEHGPWSDGHRIRNAPQRAVADGE